MYITTQAYREDDEYGEDDLFWTYSLMNEKGEHQPDDASLHGVLVTKMRKGFEFNCTGLDLYDIPPKTVVPWEFLS